MRTSVKKICSIIPLLVGLALLTVPAAKAQIGFAGGFSANLASDPGFSSTNKTTFDAKASFNLGMFYNFRIGAITLRPGIFISQADFDWELEGISNPLLSPVQNSIRMASFPIDLLYHFNAESISPYIVLGPSFNFVHTDQPDLRQTFDKPEGSTNFASFTIGAGVEIQPEGWGVILLPEIRYGLALSGFLKEDYIVRTVSYASDSAVKMNSFVVRLGVTLPPYK